MQRGLGAVDRAVQVHLDALEAWGGQFSVFGKILVKECFEVVDPCVGDNDVDGAEMVPCLLEKIEDVGPG